MVKFHPWPWWWENKDPYEDLTQIQNQKLIFAGAAGLLATALLHPLDLLKVRIQISAQPHTVKFMFKRVLLSEGYKGLYKGLSAGLFRQATNTFTRLGVYNYLNELSKTNNNRPLLQSSLQDRVQLSVYAGMAGSVVGNPAELLLVRMMAASRCPGSAHQCVRDLQKRPYKGCADGLIRIVREEGFITLWRGTALTLIRSVVINSCQISTYLTVRDMLTKKKVFPAESKMKLHATSCVFSSFISAGLSLPVDVLKSWYQIRRRGSTVREVAACLTDAKGKMFLWSGFLPYYLRMVAYTIATYYLITEFSEFIKVYKETVENSEKKEKKKVSWFGSKEK